MKALNIKKTLSALFVALALAMALAVPAFAEGPEAAPAPAQTTTQTAQAEGSDAQAKALACAIAIGLAAAGGAIGMGLVGAKSAESIARQPEADGKIRTSLMLNLVFIETAIIYALLVVILIIFVL